MARSKKYFHAKVVELISEKVFNIGKIVEDRGVRKANNLILLKKLILIIKFN